jgi:hypothetical protein
MDKFYTDIHLICSPAKAGGFSLGGLMGRKKNEPKSTSPASVKETKKDEVDAEVPEKVIEGEYAATPKKERGIGSERGAPGSGGERGAPGSGDERGAPGSGDERGAPGSGGE